MLLKAHAPLIALKGCLAMLAVAVVANTGDLAEDESKTSGGLLGQDTGFELPKSLLSGGSYAAPPVWTNCTASMATTPRDLSIGAAMTSKLYARFGTADAARAWLQTVVDGANFVFMSQMNIRMVLGDVYISPGPDASRAWDDAACTSAIDTKLQQFSSWKRPSPQAFWMLFDDCLPISSNSEFGGKSGQAMMGTLCQMGPNFAGNYMNVGIVQYLSVPAVGDFTWRVFAHEAGHIFGAGHPFGTDIVLVDGGIMAYGPGYYHCDLAFVPQDSVTICPVLAERESSCSIYGSSKLVPTGLTTEQFIGSMRPQQPVSFNVDIITCGWKGHTLSSLIAMAVAIALGVCCCLCFCFCCLPGLLCCGCGAAGRKEKRRLTTKATDDEYDEMYEYDEEEGEDVVEADSVGADTVDAD